MSNSDRSERSKSRLSLFTFAGVNYYSPHPKDGEGNSFSLFVSSHPGGKVPTLDRGYLPWLGGGYLPWTRVPTLAGGGYLPWLGGVPTLAGRGYLPWPGVPTLAGGYLDWLGVPTFARGGYLLWMGGGVHTLARTAQGVLAMWRAVCLLRSRRRTVLFDDVFTFQ